MSIKTENIIIVIIISLVIISLLEYRTNSPEDQPCKFIKTTKNYDKNFGTPSISGLSSNPCSINGICEPEWGETASNCPKDCST